MKHLCRALAVASALLFSIGAPAIAQPTHVVADSAINAPRLITLEGAQNFRDIGGYRTRDGHRVKWGLIFRSAQLSTLTANDITQLNTIGVRNIYDLRSTQERRGAPDAWSGAGAPTNVAHDYDLNTGAIAASIASANPNTIRSALADSYPAMLTSLKPELHDMFAGLLAGEGATLYHCTAGKDRTGMATALILSALGVPRETIYADYLMSNRFYHPTGGPMAGLPENVRPLLVGVDRSYLEAAFAAIDHQYGTVDNYLDRELGVNAAARARLRALYLE